jgi:hypothetical protein
VSEVFTTSLVICINYNKTINWQLIWQPTTWFLTIWHLIFFKKNNKDFLKNTSDFYLIENLELIASLYLFFLLKSRIDILKKRKHEQCEQNFSFSYINCSQGISLITINKYKKTYNPTIWPSKNKPTLNQKLSRPCRNTFMIPV